jgi:hypothetical protein
MWKLNKNVCSDCQIYHWVEYHHFIFSCQINIRTTAKQPIWQPKNLEEVYIAKHQGLREIRIALQKLLKRPWGPTKAANNGKCAHVHC